MHHNGHVKGQAVLCISSLRWQSLHMQKFLAGVNLLFLIYTIKSVYMCEL